MNAFKVDIIFHEKDGFSQEQLKKDIIKDLAEINLNLYDFKYYKNATESNCILIIEYKTIGLQYHQVVLGGLLTLLHNNNYIKDFSINPSFTEFSK